MKGKERVGNWQEEEGERKEGEDVKVREGWEEGSDGKGRERKPGERG